MTFEERKRLAEHYHKLGKKNHPYVLEMKANKGDNPKTKEIEAPIKTIDEDPKVKDKSKEVR